VPTGVQLLRQQRGPLVSVFTSAAAAGATHEIVPTGVMVAIWAVYVAVAATTTAATVLLQNQAGVDLWHLRTVGAVGESAQTVFKAPLISYDGLEAVTTGGAAGVDLCVAYSIIPTT
jgi:hypothetical protein